jgi:hypothetical protein
MHNCLACEICKGLPVDGSFSDTEFSSFVAACNEELANKQARFQERIRGASRWFYEMADGWHIQPGESVMAVGLGQ